MCVVCVVCFDGEDVMLDRLGGFGIREGQSVDEDMDAADDGGGGPVEAAQEGFDCGGCCVDGSSDGCVDDEERDVCGWSLLLLPRGERFLDLPFLFLGDMLRVI